VIKEFEDPTSNIEKRENTNLTNNYTLSFSKSTSFLIVFKLSPQSEKFSPWFSCYSLSLS